MRKYSLNIFMIVLILFVLVQSIAFTSAAIKLLCLNDGQTVHYSECNSAIKDKTCNSVGGCKICVSSPRTGVYCPTNINNCNSADFPCTYLSSGNNNGNTGGVTTNSSNNNQNTNTTNQNSNQNTNNTTTNNQNTNTTQNNNQNTNTTSSNTQTTNSSNVRVKGTITSGTVKNSEVSTVNNSKQSDLDKNNQIEVTGKTIDISTEKMIFSGFLFLITLIELGVLIYLAKLSKKKDNVELIEDTAKKDDVKEVKPSKKKTVRRKKVEYV